MKRALPMSALITGLLAAPVLGIAPYAGEAPAQVSVLREFPAALPTEVAEQARRIARGERLDTFGMQGLQRRIALHMQQRLRGILGDGRREDLVEVPVVESGRPVPVGAPQAAPTSTQTESVTQSVTAHSMRLTINVDGDDGRKTLPDAEAEKVRALLEKIKERH